MSNATPILTALLHDHGVTVWATDATGAPCPGVRVHGDHAIAVTDGEGLAYLPRCDRVQRPADSTTLELPQIERLTTTAWWADTGSSVPPGAPLRIAGVVRDEASPGSVTVQWVLSDAWGSCLTSGTTLSSPAGLVFLQIPVPAHCGRVRLDLYAGGHVTRRTFDVQSVSGPGLALSRGQGEVVASVTEGDTVIWTAQALGEDQPVSGWFGAYLPGAEGPFIETTTPVTNGSARLPLPDWEGPGTWLISASVDGAEAHLQWPRTPHLPPESVPLPELGQHALPLGIRSLGPGRIAVVGRAPFVPGRALVTVVGGPGPSHLGTPVTGPIFSLEVTLPVAPVAVIRVDLVGPGGAWATRTVALPDTRHVLAVRIAPLQPTPGTTALVCVDVADHRGRPAASAHVLLVVRDASLQPLPLAQLHAHPLLEGRREGAEDGSQESGATMDALIEPAPRVARPGAMLDGVTDARGRVVIPWTVGDGAAGWTLRALAWLPDARSGSTDAHMTVQR